MPGTACVDTGAGFLSASTCCFAATIPVATQEIANGSVLFAVKLVLKCGHWQRSSELLAGVPLDGEGLPDGTAEAVINTTAVDVLRRLPGVSEANFRPLMNAASSLAGLADLPLQQLERIMEGAAAAKKLREWLDAVCPVMS